MERHHPRRLRRQGKESTLQFLGMRRKPRKRQIYNVLRLRPVGQHHPHRHRRRHGKYARQVQRPRKDVPQHRNRGQEQHRPRLLEGEKQEIPRVGQFPRNIHRRTLQRWTEPERAIEEDKNRRQRIRRSDDTQTRQILLPILQRRQLLRRRQKHLPHSGGTQQETARPLPEQRGRQNARQPLHHHHQRQRPLERPRPQQRDYHRRQRRRLAALPRSRQRGSERWPQDAARQNHMERRRLAHGERRNAIHYPANSTGVSIAVALRAS